MRLEFKVLTLVVSTALLLCACGESTESINTSGVSISDSTTKSVASTTISSSQALQTTQRAEESTPNTKMGSFDWDTAMSELYLRGTKVSVPFSLKSLGNTFEGFEFNTPFFDESDKDVRIGIQCDKGFICYVSIDNVTEDSWNEEMTIDNIETILYFKIQGITEGTTEKEVLEIWGEPYKTRKGLYYTMLYTGRNGEYLKLLLDLETRTVKELVVFFDSSESKVFNLEKVLKLMEDE